MPIPSLVFTEMPTNCHPERSEAQPNEVEGPLLDRATADSNGHSDRIRTNAKSSTLSVRTAVFACMLRVTKIPSYDKAELRRYSCGAQKPRFVCEQAKAWRQRFPLVHFCVLRALSGLCLWVFQPRRLSFP